MLSGLPVLDQDETLFSWGARARLLSGYSARRFSLTMFGTTRAALAHSIPLGLTQLTIATRGALGDIKQLVRCHTPVGGRLAFLPPSRRDVALAAFEIGDVFAAVRSMGSAAVGLATGRIRFCRDCVDEHHSSLGAPRWLVIQQLDCVWRCLKHASPLIEIVKPNPWFLPDDSNVATVLPVKRVRAAQRNALDLAATISVTAFRLEHIDVACLRETALKRLVMRRLLKSPRNLPHAALADAFAKSSIGQWLSDHGQLTTLGVSDQIRRLLGHNDSTASGLWPIIWSWLWEQEELAASLAEFKSAASGVVQTRAGEQMSLWGNTGPASRHEIVRALELAIGQATSIADLAKNVGLSTFATSAILKENQALKEAWATRRLGERRSRAVHALETAIASGVATRGEFGRRCAVDLHWLQRNDIKTARAMLARIPDLRSTQKFLFRKSNKQSSSDD